LKVRKPAWWTILLSYHGLSAAAIAGLLGCHPVTVRPRTKSRPPAAPQLTVADRRLRAGL
jgi:hypothetical protein